MAILSGKNMKVKISREKGNLKEFYIKRFGKWNSWESYLVIVDELKEKTYKDTETPLMLFQKRHKRKGEEIIENIKEFKGADFLIKEIWKIGKDFLSWRVEVSLKKGKKDRSIQIKQFIPYPDRPYGLGVWSAQSQFPTTVERLGGLHLAYGDACFGTVIPAITLYKEKEDIGLTIAKPFGLKTSRLAFFFQDYRDGRGVEIETTLLGLKSESPAIVEFMIHSHEGCWRPGLAWLYKKYPEYFVPPNKKVREIEGGYHSSHLGVTEEKDIKSMVPFGAKWEELASWFPYYGCYAPEEKEWWKSVLNLWGTPRIKISLKTVNDHIKMVHKYKMKSLIYFQCAGDGEVPYVTKKFADSMAKDEKGSFIPAATSKTYLLNSDPATSYGKEILDMIDKLFYQFPNVDGVFLDQLCYNGLDFAHDDGITMYKNKPAYLLWHCYERPVRKLAEKVHNQGKLIFSNGPYNVEVQKDIDGHMAEGLSWIANVIKYLCISKPLLFLSSYHNNAQQAESMFQLCLLVGGSYSLWPHPSREIKKVLKVYIPLIEKLYGRKWLLEPNPIKFSDECEGNIFIGEKGNIIITVVSERRSIFDEGGIEKNLKVHVKFKGADKIRKCYSLGTHYKGRKEVKIKKGEKKGLELTVPEHSSATVIILEY